MNLITDAVAIIIIINKFQKNGTGRKTGLVEKRGWQHQIIPYMGRIAGLSEKRGWQNWFQMTPQIIPYMGRLGGLAEKRVGRKTGLADLIG